MTVDQSNHGLSGRPKRCAGSRVRSSAGRGCGRATRCSNAGRIEEIARVRWAVGMPKHCFTVASSKQAGHPFRCRNKSGEEKRRKQAEQELGVAASAGEAAALVSVERWWTRRPGGGVASKEKGRERNKRRA